MAIRWGVIGAGGIADRRTIPEGITKARDTELTAVMDADESRARAVGEKYGCEAYTREEELLARDDVDAVYIATPTYLHHRQVMMALAAGKHVLCEKPMALTLEEAGEMVEKAEETGLTLAVGFMMRFHSHHRKLKEMLERGELGQPVLGRAQLTCWYPEIPGAWRQVAKLGGGGALIDMGSHCVDLLEMFLGKVVKVSAFNATLTHKYEVEDSSVITLQFASGALGIVDNNFNIPDAAALNVLEVYGTRGSIEARGTIGQSSLGRMIARIESESRGYEAAQRREGAQEIEIPVTPVNIYQAQIEDVNCAILKKCKPTNPGERGFWNLKIMLAAYQSAREGRSISL